MTNDKKVILLYGRFSEKIDGVPIIDIPECNPNNENNWMGWTKKELEKKNFKAYCPIVPKVWQAPYADWKKEIDKFDVDKNTTLVGLSAGGAAVVRYIIEEKKFIKKLILVAPAINTAESEWKEFYDFEIDENVKKQIQNGTTIFYDTKDWEGIVKSVEIYRNKLNAKAIQMPGYGHFSFLIHTFPELLNEILMANGD